LAIFKDRFTSWSQVITLYVACALPIFLWTVPHTLVYVSQWLLRLTLWDTIGVIAYLLANAVVESLLAFLVVLLLVLVIPKRFYQPSLIALVAVFAALTTSLVVFLNVTQEGAIIDGSLTMTYLALAVYLVLLGLAYLGLRRSERVGRWIGQLIDRLVPLVLIYVFIGVLAVALVVARNLS